MTVKRIDWNLFKSLRPVKYTTAAGLEVVHDCWDVDIIGQREALAAHPVFGLLVLDVGKMRCRRTGTRNTRKRDGRVRILADAHLVASIDGRFQKFMAPFHAMSKTANECR